MSSSSTGRVAYLVLLNQIIVAQDLAGAIQQHDPEAEVLLPLNAAEALNLFAIYEGRIALAFLSLSPAQLAGHPLVSEVLLRGGWPVLVNEEAERLGDGPNWWVLLRPFTTEMIQQLLMRQRQA